MISLIIFISASIAGLWFWSSNSEKKQASQEIPQITSNIIFFYGQECPHCKDVEKFLAENNITEKVKFDSLEVSYNKASAKIFFEKAAECGLDKEEIGVPFIYSEGECLIGTLEIEAFFKEKAGIIN